VFAGASGSPPRDTLEAEALKLALAGRPVPVTAVRGTTGDFGAAGALDVAAAALALATGIVPPTLGTGPAPRAGLAVVREAPQRAALRCAVVPGLARGGMCRRLRHAAPFLLIDRVVEVDEQRGVFVKLVTATDPCVAPDGTLPAAFVLEAMARAAGRSWGPSPTGCRPRAT